MFSIDERLFMAINGLVGKCRLLDMAGIFAAKWLIYAMILSIIVLALVSVWKLSKVDWSIRSIRVVMVAFASAAVAWVGNQIFSLVFWRDRPFISLTGVNKIIDSPATGKSFPSDHSTVAFAIAFSVVMFWPRLGIFYLLAAVAVGAGRIFVGVHFPADVLAGAAVGLFWALIVRTVESKSNLAVKVCSLFNMIRRYFFGR